MLTLDALRAYGANVDEGLARCMNMEPFYLKIVGMVLADKNFEALKSAMAAGDAAAAFEAAYALKGATGNASLTPIYTPVCALSDTLKGHTDAPIGPECRKLAEETFAQLERLQAMQ